MEASNIWLQHEKDMEVLFRMWQNSCRTGSATNVVFGLALGYKSVIISILTITMAIYASVSLAAIYRIAISAVGMLSTIATGLAIDAYGPISDNTGSFAEMAGMSHKIHGNGFLSSSCLILQSRNSLFAAGYTAAAIGKGL